ncbi:NfeD family protein [Tessaracoccus caeni]|uniref:NfeD family protein n=1 Tax=Tessaracoccus caeni TaxID=3031239 RepID=UPI0023DA54CB|nr:NfeD family protein [Tessaracoccus caeni]MDF1488845.1 NfeD family protein [Tessaracoccus caeni]
MTVFLIMGAVGVVLVLTSLIFGDLIDGVFDLDFLDGDLFSLTSLAAFLGAFGFGAAIGLGLTSLMFVALAVGAVTGVAATALAIWLTRLLRRDESASSFKTSSMIGHPGIVITAIPEEGYGEIRVSVGGHVRKLTAKAPGPLMAGTEVWVSEVISPTAVAVQPAHEPRELT